MLKVLIACEYSGRVRDAFIRQGHDATSCDILPSDTPGPHYQGDVRDILHKGWDVMIAHPPCTYLCNSGVRWLYEIPGRWAQMEEAAEFFRELDTYTDIPYRAVENPVMHGHAAEIVGRTATQIVQPWMFGHTERKATGLWLSGLPPLTETNNVRADMLRLPKSEQHRIHYASPGKDRWKLRSTTYQGLADAMAIQWGEFLIGGGR